MNGLDVHYFLTTLFIVIMSLVSNYVLYDLYKNQCKQTDRYHQDLLDFIENVSNIDDEEYEEDDDEFSWESPTSIAERLSELNLKEVFSKDTMTDIEKEEQRCLRFLYHLEQDNTLEINKMLNKSN